MVRITPIKYSGNPFADAFREAGYAVIGYCIEAPGVPLTYWRWRVAETGMTMLRVADFLDGKH